MKYISNLQGCKKRFWKCKQFNSTAISARGQVYITKFCPWLSAGWNSLLCYCAVTWEDQQTRARSTWIMDGKTCHTKMYPGEERTCVQPLFVTTRFCRSRQKEHTYLFSLFNWNQKGKWDCGWFGFGVFFPLIVFPYTFSILVVLHDLSLTSWEVWQICNEFFVS